MSKDASKYLIFMEIRLLPGEGEFTLQTTCSKLDKDMINDFAENTSMRLYEN